MIKKPRRKKTAKQKWIDRLDIMASEYVRRRAMVRRGGCERCHQGKISWKTLQWAHYRSKNKHSVRWDESDAAGLCGGCHTHLDRNPKEKVEFFRILLGQEEFNRINLRAEATMRSATTDYNAIEIYLRMKINGITESG
ncbi:hypothetical protein ES707_01311 [subsurface metagenome]